MRHPIEDDGIAVNYLIWCLSGDVIILKATFNACAEVLSFSIQFQMHGQHGML